MMRILVLIPAFNEESSIVAVIEGVHASLADFEDVEIVVVDDGSTDATAARFGPGTHAGDARDQALEQCLGGQTCLNGRADPDCFGCVPKIVLIAIKPFYNRGLGK
jgi:hypothetical protein